MNKIPTDKEYKRLLKVVIKGPLTRSQVKRDKKIFKAFRFGMISECSMMDIILNSKTAE